MPGTSEPVVGTATLCVDVEVMWVNEKPSGEGLDLVLEAKYN